MTGYRQGCFPDRRSGAEEDLSSSKDTLLTIPRPLRREVWASSGLTDIQHQGHGPGKDVQNGDHGEEEAASRRSFTPEFKAEIVELCRRGDRSIGQVAKDFDLTETNVRTWVKQAELTRASARADDRGA